MFEKEAGEYAKPFHNMTRYDYVEERTHVKKAFEDGAEFGYNKAKEDMQEQGLALQSDMDKTIEQNIALKKQIEKMKSDVKTVYLQNDLQKFLIDHPEFKESE